MVKDQVQTNQIGQLQSGMQVTPVPGIGRKMGLVLSPVSSSSRLQLTCLSYFFCFFVLYSREIPLCLVQ